MNLRLVVAALSAAAIFVVPIARSTAGEVCHPIPAQEMDRQWEYYSSLSGARDSGGDDQYQCMQVESTNALVCRTKPSNPAHPSIVIRTIVQDSRGISIRMEADTATDCRAFFNMMAQFQALNAKVRETMQSRAKSGAP